MSPLGRSRDKQLKLCLVWSHSHKYALYGTASVLNVPFTAEYRFTAEGHVGVQKRSVVAVDELQGERYYPHFSDDLISIQTTSRSWDTPGLML